MANYVLIHGGWFGGWCWDKVVPLLQAAGHRVDTPTLTGLGEKAALSTPEVGLDTHIQDGVSLIETNDLQQVILVGHSYSGMVITGVADRIPDRIAHLVYLDAVIPRDGQSLADTAPMMGTFLRREANKNGDGWRVNPPRGGTFGITQEPDRSLVRSKVTPQPLKTFLQPVHITHPDAVAAIPHTYIECTRRGMIIWLLRRLFLRGSLPPTKAGWNRRTIASDHMAMILAPQAVADLLLELA
ncbi:MAG TPA: alpha/beta hydrolase [Anaerolineaceae bacterium]